MKTKIFAVLLVAVALAAGASSLPKKQTYRSEMSEEARILFVGDMMFDRTIRSIAEKKGYDHLFSCVRDYLTGFDLVIGNLEGPITNASSVSRNTKPGEAGNTAFTFDVGIVRALASHNIRMVSLGNNHILDFGIIGKDSTKEHLKKADIKYFGSPGGSLSATTTIHGYKMTVVNFNQFIGEGDSQKTVEAIWKAKRDSDLVVVYAHWGDEYVPATEYQKALAHGFIEAGADLIIGSHPHVIQESEIYNGKSIYYSLGNFIFDQYWMEEVSTGAGVEVVFGEGKMQEKEVLFDIRRDGTTCLKAS